MINNYKIAFWGSSEFSIFCLDELKNQGILPALIITTPDQPKGRGLKLEANSVKLWAKENDILCKTPETLANPGFVSELENLKCDVSLVASYGKIIPIEIINLPKYRTLNIHPSLLPKYRGPSPLQTQIINNDQTTQAGQNIGVTIMQIDEKMDHGPIVAQDTINIPNWPVNFEELEKITAKAGAVLFTKTLPDWISGKIKAVEQNHKLATITKKVEKADAELDIINGKPFDNYLKFLAYSTSPHTFFFVEKDNKKIRVIIKEAEFKDNQFIIRRIIPEGKKEMSYEDFLRGFI